MTFFVTCIADFSPSDLEKLSEDHTIHIQGVVKYGFVDGLGGGLTNLNMFWNTKTNNFDNHERYNEAY